MKKKSKRWTLMLAMIFIIVSAGLYLLHFMLFKDAHHIWLYFVGDIAFLPIDVLLVTVILHRLLEHRDKKVKMEKLNMVIGTFFSEAGTNMLEILARADMKLEKFRETLVFTPNYTRKDFERAAVLVRKLATELDVNLLSFKQLQAFLSEQRKFLLELLKNPNLFEHESFTDLLMATFHLTEELINRKDIENLSENDKKHLLLDVERVYVLLVSQWLYYMKHLKEEYPYLFSFALRTNPFDRHAKVEID